MPVVNGSYFNDHTMVVFEKDIDGNMVKIHPGTMDKPTALSIKLMFDSFQQRENSKPEGVRHKFSAAYVGGDGTVTWFHKNGNPASGEAYF